MKIFLSWSGEQSRKVALGLHSWLPDLIQAIQPWMSAADIGAGARWGQELNRELDQTSFGIICLTRDNLTAPWLLFEAGALTKSLEQGRVCPFLVGIDPSDIPNGPLSQFQAKRATRDETFQLIQSINASLGPQSLLSEQLDRAFNLWWPRLHDLISNVQNEKPAQPTVRPVPVMLNDILNEVRGISRRLPPNAPELAREVEHKRQLTQHQKVEAIVFAAPEIGTRGITRGNAAWGDSNYVLHPNSPRGMLNARVDIADWHRQSDEILREMVAMPLIDQLVTEYDGRDSSVAKNIQ